LESLDCPPLLKNCKQIVDLKLPSFDDEFKIGLFGCTGAGKTTFVNTVLEIDTLFVPTEIGAGSSSITEIITSNELKSGGKPVTESPKPIVEQSEPESVVEENQLRKGEDEEEAEVPQPNKQTNSAVKTKSTKSNCQTTKSKYRTTSISQN